jgi:hypothetical protein
MNFCKIPSSAGAGREWTAGCNSLNWFSLMNFCKLPSWFSLMNFCKLPSVGTTNAKATESNSSGGLAFLWLVRVRWGSGPPVCVARGFQLSTRDFTELAETRFRYTPNPECVEMSVLKGVAALPCVLHVAFNSQPGTSRSSQRPAFGTPRTLSVLK